MSEDVRDERRDPPTGIINGLDVWKRLLKELFGEERSRNKADERHPDVCRENGEHGQTLPSGPFIKQLLIANVGDQRGESEAQDDDALGNEPSSL